jgi:hypothetical protein
MSAIGPKQTSLVALHMSAFGGKADMTIRMVLLAIVANELGGRVDCLGLHAEVTVRRLGPARV